MNDPVANDRPTWLCAGFLPVQAATKSEARNLFKQQLREAESLTFAPQKVTRLPVGAKVYKVVKK